METLFVQCMFCQESEASDWVSDSQAIDIIEQKGGSRDRGEWEGESSPIFPMPSFLLLLKLEIAACQDKPAKLFFRPMKGNLRFFSDSFSVELGFRIPVVTGIRVP